MAQLNLRNAIAAGLTNTQIDNNFTSLQRDDTLSVSNAVAWSPNTAYTLGQIVYALESVYPGGVTESLGFLKTGVSYTTTSPGRASVNGVAVSGTAGTFTCNAETINFIVGQAINISGTNTGTGSITGYDPTIINVYYVIGTPTTTSFTLSATPGGTAITTVAGTLVGLTFVKSGAMTSAGAPNNFGGTVFTATGAGSGTSGAVTRVTRFYQVTTAGTTTTTAPNWLAPTSSTSGTATLLAIDLPPAYLPADVLTKIKLVDGVGSGLDADLLDGQNGSYYLDTSATAQTKEGDLTITGNLTVNGTTTTINSSTVSVDDKNIELGSVSSLVGFVATLATGTAVVTLTTGTTRGLIPGQALTKTSGTGVFGATPIISTIDSLTQFTASVNHATAGSITFDAGGVTDATANNGGITLKGTTDKTFSWLSASSAWTSSEHINLASTKAYLINGTSVLNATTLGSGVTGSSLTSVGTIATGTWQGTVVAAQYGGTGVNNSGKTITLGGNLTTSGAFSTTLTVSAATTLTLPTTGTLATLAGTETFSNKSFSTAVAITTTTNSTNSLTVTDTGTSGSNIRLVGNGATAPNKTIRSYNGNMQVLNHAYNAAILDLTDSGGLTVAGNVTAFSDARLKSSLNVITDALAKVEQLTGYTYTRTDSGERQTGILAQDAIKVLPEVVNTSGEYMSVAYGNFAGLIFEAIKELHAKVKDLETKIK